MAKKPTTRRVVMELFAFSKPRTRYEDLQEWKEWFTSRGIYATILPRDLDGLYVLYREGTESCLGYDLEDDDDDADPYQASPQPCIICGGRDHITDPHPFHDRYLFCSDHCERTARIRVLNGDEDLAKKVLKASRNAT